MNKIIPLSLTAFFVSFSISHGQAAFFRIEDDVVSAGSSSFNDTNYNIDPFNVTVYSATASLATLQSLSFDTENPQAFISQIQALETANIYQDPFQVVPIATGPTLNNNTWNLQRTGLTVGSYPMLLITTSPLSQLSSSDSVGLVYSMSGVIAALTTHTITFGSATTSWDTAILGNLGPFEFAPGETSLHQLTPIPEPRVYAAVLGFLALGFVAWRRRKRA